MNSRTSSPLRLFTLLVAPLLFATLVLTLGSSTSAVTQTNSSALLAVRYIDTVIEGVNVAGASDLLGPNATLHTPEGVFRGPEGANRFAETMNATFSKLDFQVKGIDTAGDTIVMPFTLTGINIASYSGLAANCAGVAVPGVIVLTIENGEIDEQWITYDQDVLRAQIDDFNQIEASRRPTCTDHEQPSARLVPVAVPEAELPPTCLDVRLCELPF